MLGVALSASCTPEITEGVFLCDRDRDCPPAMVCKLSEHLCYQPDSIDEENLTGESSMDYRNALDPDGNALVSDESGGNSSNPSTANRSGDAESNDNCQSGDSSVCQPEVEKSKTEPQPKESESGPDATISDSAPVEEPELPIVPGQESATPGQETNTPGQETNTPEQEPDPELQTVSCDDDGTEISGLLKSDQRWIRSDSPYLVRGETRVDAVSTLTIEPGTEIRFCGDFWLEILGGIQAIGNEDSPIVFHSAQIRLNTNPVGPTYDGSGNYIAGPRFEYVELTDGSLWIVNDTFDSAGPYLRHVTLWAINADFFGYINGMYAEHCRIQRLPDTTISEGSSICLENGWVRNSYVGRAILDGYSIGSAYRIVHSAFDFLQLDRWWSMNDLSFNTIRTLEWERPSTTQTASLHNNSIFDPDGNYSYALSVTSESETTAPLDATGNYWGPELTEEMQTANDEANISGILDFYDDFTLVEVDYSRFLTSPPENVGPDW